MAPTPQKYRDRLLDAALDIAYSGTQAFLAEVDAVLEEIAERRAEHPSPPPDIGGDVPGGGVRE
jgi:hypothetical protein